MDLGPDGRRSTPILTWIGKRRRFCSEVLRELARLELEYRLPRRRSDLGRGPSRQLSWISVAIAAVLDPTSPRLECRVKLAHADPLSLSACLDRYPQYRVELERRLSDIARAPSSKLPATLGDYRVLGLLGEGSMGRILLAEDVKLGRKIALKTMRPELAIDESLKRRFLREARAAASVAHDHIVAIYEVGEDRGMPFIAMPLLKGETLESCACRSGPCRFETR